MPVSSFVSRRSLTNIAFFVALILASLLVMQSQGCGLGMHKVARTAFQLDGGANGSMRRVEIEAKLEPATAQAAEREIVRTGSMQGVSNDPAQAVDKIQSLVAEFSGLVDRAVINGERQHASSAEMTLRIPAQRFDEFRARVRQTLSKVQQETVESQDVTRQATDQQATLRNYRAEEEQYLALMKRAASVKDIADVTEKLADVRGRIDRLESEIRVLQQQVQMSQLTLQILAEYTPEATEWHPLFKAREAARDALSGLTDFIDSVFAVVVFIPVALLWAVLIFLLLKLAWIVIRRLGRVFFPNLPLWAKRGES